VASKKKLQVFVSSTYEDLKVERQAAVEAILSAGHIPAGMELFAAGDRSQMEVIKRWIDESDVFVLILGGRYGSLDPESGKSYIQLEYEYAQEKGKPFFAVVIDKEHLEEKVKAHGLAVDERDNPQQLKTFRGSVTNKLVKFWKDPRDIKLAIYETLSDFSRREDLIGWVPGDQSADTGEILRLTKENASLRERLSKIGDTAPTFCGLGYEDMYQMLNSELLDLTAVERDFGKETVAELQSASAMFGAAKPTLLQFLWIGRDFMASGFVRNSEEELVDKLVAFGLLAITERSKEERTGLGSVFITIKPAFVRYGLTQDGRQFLLRLRLEMNKRLGGLPGKPG
jgi:Domain of unknown function (DUF4062)